MSRSTLATPAGAAPVDELTPEQRRAASAPGSVAVVAGAGTGKTKMLAHRYLRNGQEKVGPDSMRLADTRKRFCVLIVSRSA